MQPSAIKHLWVEGQPEVIEAQRAYDELNRAPVTPPDPSRFEPREFWAELQSITDQRKRDIDAAEARMKDARRRFNVKFDTDCKSLIDHEKASRGPLGGGSSRGLG